MQSENPKTLHLWLPLHQFYLLHPQRVLANMFNIIYLSKPCQLYYCRQICCIHLQFPDPYYVLHYQYSLGAFINISQYFLPLILSSTQIDSTWFSKLRSFLSSAFILFFTVKQTSPFAFYTHFISRLDVHEPLKVNMQVKPVIKKGK